MTEVAEAQRIDTEIAAAWLEIDKAQTRLGWAHNHLAELYRTVVGTKSTYVGKNRKILAKDGKILTREVALAWLRETLANDPEGPERGKRPLSVMSYDATWATELAKVEAAEAEAEAAREVARKLDEQYTGWSRFFVVTSSNGHIHRSMHCKTCRWSTTYGWLPQLSALTEEAAVKECGPNLCSVCFPSAPLDHQGKMTAAQARKLAYQG